MAFPALVGRTVDVPGDALDFTKRRVRTLRGHIDCTDPNTPEHYLVDFVSLNAYVTLSHEFLEMHVVPGKNLDQSDEEWDEQASGSDSEDERAQPLPQYSSGRRRKNRKTNTRTVAVVGEPKWAQNFP